MKVSIIVPVYNTGEFLLKCIKSLISQTIDDFEIIIVDDGSTDGSSDLCDTLALEYPKRISTYHKPNGGLSSARNFGLERSNGEYIVFVDSDDYCGNDMLEKLLGYQKQYDGDLIISDYAGVRDGEVVYHRTKYPFDELHIEDNIQALELLFDNIGISACGVLFRKDILRNNRFTVGIIDEDFEQKIRYLLSANKILYIPDVFYFYVNRCGSITKSSFNLKKCDYVDNALNGYFQVKAELSHKRLLEKAKSFYILRTFHWLNIIINDKNREMYHEQEIRYRSILLKNILFIIFKLNASIRYRVVIALLTLIPMFHKFFREKI